ncbi:hypothetical protein PFLUV_G00056470 [Perca fluviatilis]|uniref:Uncharacterized protein n=1 Tax=Perca fluviatilis TaxID=8168 RepID=A0A6A5FIX0_PERFL|nr:hypothetical protein PFLUV_G00056470 [Perca fluviatilis]
MGAESLVVDVRQSHKAKRLLPVLIQPPPLPPPPPPLPPPGLQHCSPLDSSCLDISNAAWRNLRIPRFEICGRQRILGGTDHRFIVNGD